MGGSRTWGSSSEATEAVAEAPPQPNELQPGSVVGRYRVESPIGAGGMGVVVAARDPELDRPVAIKIMHHADALAERWLRREAQALAQLNHPNIVDVLDVGMFDDRPFIAMEFIEGVTLRAWLAAKTRSAQEILTVFKAAGRALAAAHAARIVHCDFKPSNVMIRRGASHRIALADAVSIMDFGLARSSSEDGETQDEELHPGASASLSAEFTGFGKVRGTPKYMAPEQFALEEVGPPADQFAFCIALFEALWRCSPFPAETPAARMAERLNGTRAERPATPRSQRKLVDAVLRGLEPRPEDRWPTMGALVDALQPPSRRRAWAAGGLAAVALCGAAASFAPDDQRCTNAGSMLETIWNDDERAVIGGAFAQSERPFAAHLWETGRVQIDGWADRWVSTATANCRATYQDGGQSERDYDARLLCLERQANTLASVLDGLRSVSDDTVGRALNTVAILPEPADCTANPELFSRPSDAERSAAVDAGYAAVDRCRVLTAAGDVVAASACAETTLATAVELGHLGLLFEARGAQVVALSDGGKTTEAVRVAEALYFDAHAGGHTQLAARTALQLAFSVATTPTGDVDAARQWLRRADAMRHSEAGTARYARIAAHVERRSGHHDAAIERAREAVELEQRVGTDTRLGLALNTLGYVLADAGQREEARDVYERSLEVHRALTGEAHDTVATANNNLGSVLMQLGELEASLPRFERALQIRRGILPAKHRQIATATANIGETYARLGHYERALPFYVESADVFEAVEGPQSAEHTRMRLRVATALRELGRFSEAREAVDIALDICRHQPLEDGDRFRAEQELAFLEEAEGNPGAAVAFFESALRAPLRDEDRALAERELERLRRN